MSGKRESEPGSSKFNPLHVREIRPRWRTVLIVGGSVVAITSGAVSVWWNVFKDNAIEQAADDIEPIGRLADRINKGLDRIGGIIDGNQEGDDGPSPRTTTHGTETGPQIIHENDGKGNWSWEFKFPGASD